MKTYFLERVEETTALMQNLEKHEQLALDLIFLSFELTFG